MYATNLKSVYAIECFWTTFVDIIPKMQTFLSSEHVFTWILELKRKKKSLVPLLLGILGWLPDDSKPATFHSE